MTDYTPEPWPDLPRDRISLLWSDYNRARACVNACAGIPTEQLGPVLRLVQAMDTLMEALPEDGEWGHFIDIKDEARAALAPFRKE